MHQIRFRFGFCPKNPLGERFPDPLFGFKGPTSNGMEGQEGGGVRKKRGKKKYCAVIKIP